MNSINNAESAKNIGYNNTSSGLSATDAQGAIDEVNSSLSWKYVDTKTGSTEISLPVKWNELNVVVSFGGNPSYGGTFHICNLGYLNNNTRYYVNGCYKNTDDHHQFVVQMNYDANKIKLVEYFLELQTIYQLQKYLFITDKLIEAPPYPPRGYSLWECQRNLQGSCGNLIPIYTDYVASYCS